MDKTLHWVYFYERTIAHVCTNLIVQKFLADKFNEVNGKCYVVNVKHDQSKFSEEQINDYFAKCEQFHFSDEKMFDNKKSVAITNHRNTEDHHPEKFSADMSKMSDQNIFEMCCDWISIAAENNVAHKEDTFLDFWQKRACHIYKFTDDQKNLIEHILTVAEDNRRVIMELLKIYVDFPFNILYTDDVFNGVINTANK